MMRRGYIMSQQTFLTTDQFSEKIPESHKKAINTDNSLWAYNPKVVG